ncbi:MAG: M20 family metallo-hydrolase [Methanobacteriota archaeon]|nr:MAG: M20 family metallo-hydrolase [Euryarchaeota archaeon]
MNVQQMLQSIANDEERVVATLCDMLSINAVGPENGGPGETERGEFLVSLAKALGFEHIELYMSEDPRVPSGKRPNIIIRVKGTTEANVWVVTHMDVVPEGDLSAWTYPPFEPKVVDGRVYARGAEDNGQDLIASLFGLAALVKAGVTPECNICLAFVSDEEYGNTHGIDLLLEKGLFKEGDLIIVPDHGYPDGASMAIVEKSVAWMRVVVKGRQTHGSTPENGINAFEVSSRYLVECMDRLRSRFSKRDALFDPPQSTFVPTKSEPNGRNINTVPGRQEFACDFRVLPDYDLDDVMSEMRAVANEHEKMSGAKIELGFIDKSLSAGSTSPDAEVVMRLKRAIKCVGGFEPKPTGIGGATFANPFRRAGLDAVSWSTIPGTGHDANEYIEVTGLMFDTKVYAIMFAGENLSDG